MRKLVLSVLAVGMLVIGANAETLISYERSSVAPYEEAIGDYLLKEMGQWYTPEDVSIPVVRILDIDDSDPANVSVWGVYEIHNYDLLNTTLVTQSGGSNAGRMELIPDGEGYCVSAVELVEDGSGYTESANRIFGMREGLAEKFHRLDPADMKAARLQAISEYVNRCGLPVTQYQDFGWAPVPLINAPLTTDAENMFCHISPLGYEITYDLREFSFHSWMENEEGFSGVDNLNGISLNISLLTESEVHTKEKEIIEGFAMAELQEVPIGADDIRALRIRDAVAQENILCEYYIVPLDEAMLVISLSNTYYASAGDPVVPGGAEALTRLLQSFRLAD